MAVGASMPRPAGGSIADRPAIHRRRLFVLSEAAVVAGRRSAGALTALSRFPRQAPGLRASFFPFMDQLLVSGGNFVTTVVIARALGLESFGWYTLIWLAVLFSLAMQLGLVVSPMMSIGPKQDSNEAPGYFGVVVLHEALFCAAAMGGIGASVALLVDESRLTPGLPLAAATAGAGFLLQDFTRRLLFTRARSHVVVSLDALNYAARLGLLAWFGSQGVLSISNALWIIGGTSLAATALAVPFAGPLRFELPRFGQVSVRQWRSAKWLVATGAMHWVTSNSALLISGGLLGIKAVAAWRAAQSVLGVLNIGREVMENILPHEAGRALASRGIAGLKPVLIIAAGISLCVSAVVVAVMAMYGNDLLRLVYGPEFSAYGFIIGWLSLSFPAALLVLLHICAFRALEQTSTVFWSSATGAAVNIGLMYPAIALFGISGAIAATLITEFVVLAILVLFLRRALRSEASAAAASSQWEIHSDHDVAQTHRPRLEPVTRHR